MAAGERGGGDREAELLRINAELAAEIRDLTAGRTSAPRPAAGPAARGVSRLIAERDELAAERDELSAELDRLREHGEAQGNQLQDQARQIDELSHEVRRLRGGIAGFARRARARLLRR